MKVTTLKLTTTILSCLWTPPAIYGFIVASKPSSGSIFQVYSSRRSSRSHTPNMKNAEINNKKKHYFFSSSSSSLKSSNPSGDNNQVEKATSGTWNPLRLAVLKLGFTELKFTSPLNYEKRDGTYNCANCDTELFNSRGKYDSGSGWPSFYKTSSENRVGYVREWDGRVEVTCKSCGGHLGHVFPDGPMRKEISEEDLITIPSDDLKTSDESNVYTRLPRYCVNGASLKFKEQ